MLDLSGIQDSKIDWEYSNPTALIAIEN